jgi:AcrR family transcriptional regulator
MDGSSEGETTMARKPQQEKPEGTDREKIVRAFMALLAERPIEEISFGEVAGRAGLSLAECRAEFGSLMAVLAAQVKAIDRQVLEGGDPDLAGEPPRERLFDVLMRRLEALAPHKAAIRSLMRSARRNPGLALALNAMAVRSQQWMLTAADMDAAGTRGMVRAQGLALLYASVLRTWVDDEDPGQARTMAALDRELARGARCGALLDDICGIASVLGRLRPGRRWRRRDRQAPRPGDEPVATPAP